VLCIYLRFKSTVDSFAIYNSITYLVVLLAIILVCDLVAAHLVMFVFIFIANRRLCLKLPGDRSVGRVRSRTKATEFFLFDIAEYTFSNSAVCR
jgi:hypothetical protein